MRGAVWGIALTRVAIRITPAYAGSRLDNNLLLAQTSDHPRVCGEQPTFNSNATNLPGSPPRMRGADLKKDVV